MPREITLDPVPAKTLTAFKRRLVVAWEAADGEDEKLIRVSFDVENDDGTRKCYEAAYAALDTVVPELGGKTVRQAFDPIGDMLLGVQDYAAFDAARKGSS